MESIFASTIPQLPSASDGQSAEGVQLPTGPLPEAMMMEFGDYLEVLMKMPDEEFFKELGNLPVS